MVQEVEDTHLRFKDAAKRDTGALDNPSDNWEGLAENWPGCRRRLRNGEIRLDKVWLAKSAKKGLKMLLVDRLLLHCTE